MGKAILICIYAETDNGGFWGPIFDDMTFEGIPTPADYDTGPEFESIIGVHGRSLSEYIPQNAKITPQTSSHFDPDPIHLTYGDRMNARAAESIRKMKKGDLILWAARLQKFDGKNYNTKIPPRTYLIGWLKVEWILDCRIDKRQVLETELEQMNQNSHLIDATVNDDFKWVYTRNDAINNLMLRKEAIAYGIKNIGGQLKYAIPLTHELIDGSYPILEELQGNLFEAAEQLLRIGPYNLNYDNALQLILKKEILNPSLPFFWQ
jgi:hypothetical protein